MGDSNLFPQLHCTHSDNSYREAEYGKVFVFGFAMNDRQEVGGGNIEERTPGECDEKGGRYFTCLRNKYIREIKSNRCCKSEKYQGQNLCFFPEFRFLKYGCERERNGDLVDSHSEEYAVPESCGYPEPGTYSESVEEGVDENRNSRDESYMVVVLMRILMSMIIVLMIVLMLGEELLHEIDGEETSHKRINGKLTRNERFR